MKIPPNCLANKIKEQLFFWTGEDVETVLKQLETLEGSLAANSGLCLFELAYSIYLENRGHKSNSCNIAIVAESINELKAKIASAKESLKAHLKFIRDSKGIYFSSNPLSKRGEIAFLFSGQGSQRPDMFKELNSLFPQMQESISKADAVLKNRLPKLLSEYIYPPAYRLRAGLPSVSTCPLRSRREWRN